MATENKENENALAPTSEIVRVYNEVTSVDDTSMIAARLARLSGFVVTGDEENVKAAKKTRAALNGLAKDASAARMRVQRAIKAHPIGAFAFEKSDLEREIEKESKRLGDDIARAVNAPKVRLNEEVDTYVCFVRGTLAQINKLAVYANEELGIHFENRGPVAPEGAQTQPMM
jgi:predicted hydrocarbon binding protein